MRQQLNSTPYFVNVLHLQVLPILNQRQRLPKHVKTMRLRMRRDLTPIRKYDFPTPHKEQCNIPSLFRRDINRYKVPYKQKFIGALCLWMGTFIKCGAQSRSHILGMSSPQGFTIHVKHSKVFLLLKKNTSSHGRFIHYLKEPNHMQTFCHLNRTFSCFTLEKAYSQKPPLIFRPTPSGYSP